MVGLGLYDHDISFKKLKIYSFWTNLKKLNLSENNIAFMECILSKRPINLEILDLSNSAINIT